MRKNKENDFAHKFRLLNSQSQECTDDINWSMSSSNDEENIGEIICNMTNRRRYTKRKRRRKLNNISNLDITVVDSFSTRTESIKSPILCDKTSVQVSPILESKLSQRSPILMPRSSQKSPILHRKFLKVNRKLFKRDNVQAMASDESIKEIRSEINKSIDLSKTDTSDTSDKHLEKSSKHDIYRHVRCYFESNFTSDNASQNSISDTTTPKDSVSSDIDISNGTTDHESDSIQKICKSSREEIFHNNIEKKIRYKKDGHAYRLAMLLKKQNASHSLWKHEKFLADNSNFIIPKEEHLIFRVRQAESEYGCCILNAVDENDLNYCILINNVYLNEKIECDSILKIYKPYTMINCEKHRVMLNVRKYDQFLIKVGEK